MGTEIQGITITNLGNEEKALIRISRLLCTNTYLNTWILKNTYIISFENTLDCENLCCAIHVHIFKYMQNVCYVENETFFFVTDTGGNKNPNKLQINTNKHS